MCAVGCMCAYSLFCYKRNTACEVRISDWSSDVCSSDLYVSDYTYAFDRLPIYLRHSWSLSVEEQFYLLWPLVLPLVLRGRRALIWLMIAYIAVLAWRFSFIGDWRSYSYRFDTRAKGLIAGIIIHFTLPTLALRPAHS